MKHKKNINNLRKILQLMAEEDLKCQECCEPLYHTEEIVEAVTEWLKIDYEPLVKSYRNASFFVRLRKAIRIYKDTKQKYYYDW